ncbi:MAG TPA: SWIM zinc finger family protein [Methanothermococcus okinawensis]|nr:SWIM zinc finger family protein [Methanothermococcus okinawensis]
MYESKIRERGRNYYRNNLVKYCVKFGNKLYGKVLGGELYNTVVDLKDYSGTCSCSYRYNCKHAYALIEAFLNNDYIDGDKIFEDLKKKSKEEILEILRNVVVEYNLWKVIIKKDSNLLEEGRSILKLIPYERKNIYTFKSFLRNRFLKNSKDEELLKLLEDILSSSYFEDEELYDMLDMILHEIFERGNREVVEKLFVLAKKYNILWFVEEYYYDYNIR